MADAGTDRLLAFALGTWHAALLLVALALTLHLAGATQGLFASLDTLAGLSIGALLWGLSCWTTRQAIDGLDWDAPLRLGDLLARGGMWGAATGGFFVAGVIVSAAVVLREPRVLVLGLFGGAFAPAAGAVVGIAAALVDVALAAAARRLSRAGRSP